MRLPQWNSERLGWLRPWCAGVGTLWLWLLWACALPVATSAQAEPALKERLQAAMAVPALKGARVGALVVEASSGKVEYLRNPAAKLTPASNMKVLTGLAAIAEFGPTHQFTTTVYSDAPPNAAGEVNYLAVRGGGDPSLTSEEWWRLAADLRLAGVRVVRGPIYLDDSVFDKQRWHPSWGSVSARAYYGPVSGLAANYGAFALTVHPGDRSGAVAKVIVDPPLPYLVLRAGVTTGAAGTARRLKFSREDAGGLERLVITGSIPLGGEPHTLYRSVADPTNYAGAVFRMQLAANDISVVGEARKKRVPDAAHELLVYEGKPMGEIVRLLGKYSSNVIAESLVKAMGAKQSGSAGSWKNGMAAMRERLQALGLDLSGATLVDGSGLSRENRVSPRILIDALRLSSNSFRFGPELMTALPISNGDGTLEKRVVAAPGSVRAKTGLLNGVTALSGFAEADDGRTLAFSVLVNGYRSSDEQAMDALDGFAAALVD